MGENPCELDFVAVGLGGAGKLHLEKLVDLARIMFVDGAGEFDRLIDGFEMNDNATIFVGDKIEGLNPMELGQALRASFINAHIIFVATETKDFSASELKKNGYSKALLLPMDKAFFEELVIASSRGGVRKRFKAVKMVDIEPGERLDVSVYFYMPANKKYGLLTANGSLSEKKYGMLKSKSENTVFIQAEQAEKFYEYSAEKIARLSEGEAGNGSETERSERLKAHVQELFHNLLDRKSESSFDSGRDFMEQSHKIVQKFVETKAKVNLKEQIDRIFDASDDTYSHAQSVSTLGCLLSMAIGVGKPEELAIAGLFHDIGIAGLPSNPDPLVLETLSEEDKKRFIAHPIASVHLLKNKKVVLTPEVSEMIEKHHERVDGKGYPAALPAHKIPLSAQLLAFCDWFEYLRRSKPGSVKPTPLEVIEEIQAKAGLSLELILKVKKFFQSLPEAPLN